jgi:hypothetical protein
MDDEARSERPATPAKRGHGVAGRSGPPGNKNARKHGMHSLKRALNELRNRAIDNRTSMAKALAAWRGELIADLGGIENITTQELALIEEAVKTKLLLDSVDSWLLAQPSLIDKRRRTLLPVVRDRQSLVATLRGLLGDLGLKRRSKSGPTLREYLNKRSDTESTDAAGPEQSVGEVEDDNSRNDA